MRNGRHQRMFRWIGLAAIAAGVFIVGISSDRDGPSPALAAGPAAGPYDKHAAVDPIEANGPIFVDWPRPDVALLFTGEQDGFLEPCGCAGLDNQKGGQKRRHTLFKQLRADGWPIVPLDLGGQTKRFGLQTEMKFDYALRGLAEMGYAAVGFGPTDLRLDILSHAINLDDSRNRFVSANVGIIDFDSGFTKRFQIVEAGGMKIGVTAVLGKQELAGLRNSDDLKLVDPEAALAAVLPALRGAGCDRLVLLSFAELAETKALARQFPDFDFVVTAYGADEPPNEPQAIDGVDAQLIEVGHKGMYVIVVGLYKNSTQAIRYQRVPLDSRFPDSPEMQQVLVDYQRDLEVVGLEGHGLKPSAHPTSRTFAGSESCADCHTAATEVYLDTTHAHALETLVKLVPPRHFDPECLSCHVVGWDSQKHFPFVSGYLGLEQTPLLVGNGCENCHGPSARHAAAENGEFDASDEELEQLRAVLRLKVVENEGNKEGQEFAGGKVVQMCMQCHDLDNSPDFDFQTYWPKIKHEGMD